MIGWFNAENWEKEKLEEKELDMEIHSEALTEKNCEKFNYEKISVFTSSEVTAKVLEEVQPEEVFTRSTGFDHIDTDKAEELGVSVYNVPHYGSNTVAEHAFGLLLSLSKNIPKAAERTHQEFSHEGLTGFELADKKFGVIGTGDIGQKAIKMAKGFDMDVIAYDPYGNKNLESDLGFMYVSMEDLLTQSDIISLHCPLTKNNRHMLAEEEFTQMEDTVLINTARGELINSSDLLKALKKGNIRSAGLDVMEMEEEMQKRENYQDKTEFCCEEFKINCELIERNDVLTTPHNAFNTEEAKMRILDTTIENIEEQTEKNRIT